MLPRLTAFWACAGITARAKKGANQDKAKIAKPVGAQLSWATISSCLLLLIVWCAVCAGLPSEADAAALHQRTAAAQRRVDRLVRRSQIAAAGIIESPTGTSDSECELDVFLAAGAGKRHDTFNSAPAPDAAMEIDIPDTAAAPESAVGSASTVAAATVSPAAGLAPADDTEVEEGPWQRRCGNSILPVEDVEFSILNLLEGGICTLLLPLIASSSFDAHSPQHFALNT
jgi:hypothetical protein